MPNSYKAVLSFHLLGIKDNTRRSVQNSIRLPWLKALINLHFKSWGFMAMEPLVSICILSYNRPEMLLRLLKTIDTQRPDQLEIVVCEDCSPRQIEIRSAVEQFQAQSKSKIVYHENEKNLGFDGNLCELVRKAAGKWLVFMGDDDEFIPGALDKYMNFCGQHPELSYVMKSHFTIYENNRKELFKYFKETTFFEPGVSSYVSLFRRSVFIAGFTIQREFALPYLTNRFDGTMLMQIYLLAEVVMIHPSAYFDEPFTQRYASLEHDKNDVMFDREKQKFVARQVTLKISLDFLDSFSKITRYMDDTYKLNSTALIKKDMSKYFYPSLAIHRDAGLPFFFNYVKELNKLGFNASVYYDIYVVLLTIFGKKTCDWGIYFLKTTLGRTPQL
jgi:abequosyltransferase